jgi:hypothetical protein
MRNESRTSVAICLAVLCLGLSSVLGCGSSRSPYPEAKVKTALGAPSTCAHCRKAIPRVEKENMVTFKGVAYTVCDAKCAADLEEWAKAQ